MGRILEYVVLLGNISLIVAIGQSQRESLLPRNYEPRPQQNFTYSNARLLIKKDDGDASFDRKIGGEGVSPQEKWPPIQNGVKPKPNTMSKTPGLSSFASEPMPAFKRRNLATGSYKNGYYSFSSPYRDGPRRGYIPPHSQRLIPTKNYNKGHDGRLNPTKDRIPRLTAINSEAISSKLFTSLAAPTSNYNSYQNHPSNAGRNPRLFHQRQNSKMCEPCNSVPWVPILDVPSSYRKHRKQNFGENGKYSSSSYNNIDYHAVSSDTHNYVLPSNPLIPPTPTILDGTISSSFGLPVGNIPTGHGLLAPLNHFLSSPTSDYSTATTFFSPPTLLDGSPIPELSPVPIVPVYDSGQFYTGPLLDSSDIGLVPPTSNSLSVSNVVFTISEGNPPTLYPQDFGGKETKLNEKLNFKEVSGEASATGTGISSSGSSSSSSSSSISSVSTGIGNSESSGSSGSKGNSGGSTSTITSSDSSSSFEEEAKTQVHKQRQTLEQQTILQPPKPNFGGIEIVKSVPLAEFTTGPGSSKINQNHGSSIFQNNVHQVQNHISLQSEGSNHLEGKLNVVESNPSNYLVPPPRSNVIHEINSTFNTQPPTGFGDVKHSESQYQASFHDSNSALKPLTGPSATSWIFADSSIQLKGSTVNHHKPLFTGSQSIASIVNSEFQPIPAQVLPISQSTESTKSKKVQIIIPYTTKSKTELDTNSFESVRQEVFQTLQSLSNKSELEYAAKFEGHGSNRWDANKTAPYNKNDSNVAGSSHRHSELDRFSNPKYVAEMQHILAKNIRELLYREIEKAPVNQNYLLQNNIDNWTALEYSNHQVIAPKQTKETISQPFSVTSIPGTSTISHHLLPSKKIPDEYFASTKSPLFEELASTIVKNPQDSVQGKPFTVRPETTVTNTTDSALSLSSPSPFVLRLNDSRTLNHGNNYTIVGKSRVNYWNKLNENLVVPESVNSTTKDQHETTVSVTVTPSTPLYSKTYKVEIVTPVSVTTRKVEPTKRTTRHVRVTERTLFKRNFTRPFHRLKFSPPSFKLNNVPSNSRKAVNASQSENGTSSVNNTADIKKFFNRKSVQKINVFKSQEEPGKIRTTSDVTNQTVVPRSNNNSEVANQNVTSNVTRDVAGVNVTTTTTIGNPIKTNQSEELSINDIIPFRNKEQPWDSEVKNEDARQSVPRQRKSLIKQVKSTRRPRRSDSFEVDHSLRPQSTSRNLELGT